MNDTLRELIVQLQKRLNDKDAGNYPAADGELHQCINTAIMDTELITKCHIATLASQGSGAIESVDETPVAAGTGYAVGDILTLSTGTGGTVEVVQVALGVVVRVKLLTRGLGYTAATTYATTYATTAPPATNRADCTVRVNVVRAAMQTGIDVYDIGPIFEPVEVSLHWTTTGDTPVTTDEPLAGRKLKDMQADADYNITASGKPSLWYPLSGSQIQVYPAPDRSAGANNYLRVRGFAVSSGLTSDYDRPTSIPEGYRIPCILDRAEAEARKMRLTTIPNTTLYGSLMDRWADWCSRIIASGKGVGK